MKFIVDAQLPKLLSDLLNEKGFNSLHTLDLPAKNQTKDQDIAKLANNENRIVITKDIDFLGSFLLKSEPRKLIVVKTGNISNKDLVNIFKVNLETIIVMISRSNLLEITSIEIAEHY